MGDLTREQIEAIRSADYETVAARLISGRLIEDIDALCTMALRALDAGWQPMSTAPRDAMRALITDIYGQVWIGVVCATTFRAEQRAWMPLPPPCEEVPHE